MINSLRVNMSWSNLKFFPFLIFLSSILIASPAFNKTLGKPDAMLELEFEEPGGNCRHHRLQKKSLFETAADIRKAVQLGKVGDYHLLLNIIV